MHAIKMDFQIPHLFLFYKSIKLHLFPNIYIYIFFMASLINLIITTYWTFLLT